MKNTLLLALALPALCLAAGNVQQTAEQIGTGNVYAVSFRFTADAVDGSIPATVAQIGRLPVQGYAITSVEYSPGSPTPSNFSMTLPNKGGVDMLGGSAIAVTGSAAASFSGGSNVPPMNGAFTLTITGQSTPSAKGTVIVYLAPLSAVVGIQPSSAGSSSLSNFYGAVVMRRPNPAVQAWVVNAPDGSLISTIGDQCQGLQTAINYGWTRGYPVIVAGGGVTPPTTGLPSPSTAYSGITCSSGLVFPTGWNNYFQAQNINLYCIWGTNSDCVTYDSTDLTTIDWMDSQFLYAGTGAIHRFNPQHNNGESFAGFIKSGFHLGHAICVVNPGYAPDPSKGTGVRVTVPNLAAGYTNGNGNFWYNILDVPEINGCTIGIQVDNPAAGSNGFANNKIIAPGITNQGTFGVKIGTSALTNTGQDTSWANQWYLTISPGASATGISTYGGADSNTTAQWQGDTFYANISSGSVGIVFQSSATNNLYISSSTSAGTPYTNSATNQTNQVIDTRGITAGSITPSGSPFIYQNQDMKPEGVIVSGGTVSAVETTASATCSGGWFTMGATAGTFPLKVGQCMRVTYTVAPSMNKVF